MLKRLVQQVNGGWLALAFVLVERAEQPDAKAAALEEWQIGGQITGNALLGSGGSAPGATLGADLQYGLTDAWAWRASLEAGPHRGNSSIRWRGTATAGATYTVDIVRWLPFFEVGLCAAALSRSPAYRLGGQVGLGADYLLDRRWAVAPVIRYSALPVHFGDDESSEATLHVLALAIRLSCRFE